MSAPKDFEKQWRKANHISKAHDFGTTDDVRAGRCDEIDLAFFADYIEWLEDQKVAADRHAIALAEQLGYACDAIDEEHEQGAFEYRGALVQYRNWQASIE